MGYKKKNVLFVGKDEFCCVGIDLEKLNLVKDLVLMGII